MDKPERPRESAAAIDSSALESTAAALRAKMERTNHAREAALRSCREAVQFASRSIRALHRSELTAARSLADESARQCARVKQMLEHHPELYYAGYVHDSQKEYVEAEAMLAIVTDSPLPEVSVLNVEPAAYLNGLAEAASESRRYVLDKLRLGDLPRAEAALKVMDDIYYELVTFDFPDAITGGLRRTTDSLRAVLERTRGDLTVAIGQRRLEAALQQAESGTQERYGAAPSPEGTWAADATSNQV